AHDGSGDGVLAESGRLPDLLSSLEIVAAHLRGCRDDDLFTAGVGNHDRTAPVGGAIALRAPELAAGALLESHEERIAVLLIEHEQELVAFERGPGAFAEFAEHAQLAEILLPDELAVERVAVDAARAEERDQVLAVGDRRVRGEA